MFEDESSMQCTAEDQIQRSSESQKSELIASILRDYGDYNWVCNERLLLIPTDGDS